MKLVSVVGARPQFIKAAVVSAVIQKHNQLYKKKIMQIIIHTGQHFDPEMSDIFFDELKLPTPKYHLGIHKLSHGTMVGRMIEGIEKVLIKEKPDWVLVYGDTNSTLAGAIAAKKLGIHLAHVEAGLRSFNLQMAEEQNRILTDRISNFLFCPTAQAVDNLKKEGIPSSDNCYGQRVFCVGDVMYDSLLFYARQIEKQPLPPAGGRYNGSGFILATIHRAENTDDAGRMKNILKALQQVSKELSVILPLHPRTRKNLLRFRISTEGITLIKPVSYLEMLGLEKNCRMIITDSGGVQKEAYFFKKPCITLREETEWTELRDLGVNRLVSANKEKIVEQFEYLASKKLDFSSNPYGNGDAGNLIIKALGE